MFKSQNIQICLAKSQENSCNPQIMHLQFEKSTQLKRLSLRDLRYILIWFWEKKVMLSLQMQFVIAIAIFQIRFWQKFVALNPAENKFEVLKYEKKTESRTEGESAQYYHLYAILKSSISKFIFSNKNLNLLEISKSVASFALLLTRDLALMLVLQQMSKSNVRFLLLNWRKTNVFGSNSQ